MTTIVNVGLKRPGGGHMDPSTVLRAFRNRGLTHRRAALHTSDSEDTIVIELPHTLEYALGNRGIGDRLYRIAEELEQDCVAVRYNTYGDLVGPRASRWGKFDPAMFIQLDGTRLDQRKAA